MPQEKGTTAAVGTKKRGWYVARRNGAGTRERERVMVEDGASTGQGEGGWKRENDWIESAVCE